MAYIRVGDQGRLRLDGGLRLVVDRINTFGSRQNGRYFADDIFKGPINNT